MITLIHYEDGHVSILNCPMQLTWDKHFGSAVVKVETREAKPTEEWATNRPGEIITSIPEGNNGK